jgi:hypothetical protein
MAISEHYLYGTRSQCGRRSTRLHTRKTGDVDGLCGRASTPRPKPAESLGVDVWTVWTPYRETAASTRRPLVLPREAWS